MPEMIQWYRNKRFQMMRRAGECIPRSDWYSRAFHRDLGRLLTDTGCVRFPVDIIISGTELVTNEIFCIHLNSSLSCYEWVENVCRKLRSSVIVLWNPTWWDSDVTCSIGKLSIQPWIIRILYRLGYRRSIDVVQGVGFDYVSLVCDVNSVTRIVHTLNI